MSIPTINPQLIVQRVTATAAAKIPWYGWQLIQTETLLGPAELAEHPQTKIRVRIAPHSTEKMTTQVLMDCLKGQVRRLIQAGHLSVDDVAKYATREFEQSPLN